MERIVDYYFVPQSPWTYLGHARFAAILAQSHATAAVKPVDLGRVFAVSGGLPLAQRAPQRQTYRLLELARYGRHLGLPIVVQPRYFPVSADIASRTIAATVVLAPERALDVAFALGRAVWAEERDIADAATVDAIVAACGLDSATVRAAADSPAAQQRIDADTDEAIAVEVFGAPTYVPRFGPARGERFWGQDRLDLLAAALAA